MTVFNINAWRDFITGKTSSYRFAPENCSKSEYMQGLLNSARGIISIFDNNKKDMKLDLNEYLTAHRTYNKMNNYGHDFWTNDKIKEEKIKKYSDRFNKLDINQDGFLSEKEIANELSIDDYYKVVGKENDGSIRGNFWMGNMDHGTKLQENYKNLFGVQQERYEF